MVQAISANDGPIVPVISIIVDVDIVFSSYVKSIGVAPIQQKHSSFQ